MRSDRELLEDALCLIDSGTKGGMAYDITREIRARLAEPDDDPVAWLAVGDGKVGLRAYLHKENALDHTKNIEPLYRHPRQPVRLTDDEVKQVIRQTIPDVTVSESVTFRAIARAIEKAIWEKKQ